MRLKTTLSAAVIVAVLSLSTIGYAQKLDTTNQSAFNASLTEIFNTLSPDGQLEFEAFLYCLLDEGKTLVRVSKLKGINELKEYYPIIEAMEDEGVFKMDGLTADEVIAQGKALLSAKLQDKLKTAESEAQQKKLEAQLAIIEKKALTREDLEAYNELK